jgi:ribonuclease H / adenosylcobalamin/alpha-ribazole phosphatase
MRPPGAGDGAAGAAGRAAGGGPVPAGSWEPPTGPGTRLILVRHGATELSAQRRYSGRGDVPLTAQGLAQAEAVGRRVAALAAAGAGDPVAAGVAVAAVVSSPLVRCTATAAAIIDALRGVAGEVPLITDGDLIECDFGRWEGHTGDEVRARWPGEFDAWQRSTAVAPPGGESFAQVAQRVRRVVDSLCEAYPASTVVVVSHVSPLKLILRDALAAGDGLLRRLFLDAGGISVVDLYPGGAVAVRAVNDTSHLLWHS